MKKVMLCGDTHGDIYQIKKALEAAMEGGVDAIFVLGDFGYWEHLPAGVAFLDETSHLATQAGVPVYFLDGNHENHPLLWSTYTETNDEGFIIVRDNLYYAPRGHRWTWGGVRFLALGGAYSIDREFREIGESWWPEEQITDEDVVKAIGDGSTVDIMLTHDKPRAADPHWRKPDLPACHPNQWQVQRVVTEVKPDLLVHGHLHHRYEDRIHNGDGGMTRVVGLDCEMASFSDFHMLLTLEATHVEVRNPFRYCWEEEG